MKKLFSIYIPSFCLMLCLIALLMFSTSCEKEYYPIIEKIRVTYMYDADFDEDSLILVEDGIVGYNPTDTIKDYYELDTLYQYYGDDPELFVQSKNPGTIKITWTCGGYVDDVHYVPLTKHVQYYVKYILW